MNIYWIWYTDRYKPYSRNGKHYRKLPVPHTRCSRGGFGWFRRPQTKMELTINNGFDHCEERKFYKIKIRRSRVKLVTNWDDIHRDDAQDRNWKRHRKHQYKG
jgi:hypothetical protein